MWNILLILFDFIQTDECVFGWKIFILIFKLHSSLLQPWAPNLKQNKTLFYLILFDFDAYTLGCWAIVSRSHNIRNCSWPTSFVCFQPTFAKCRVHVSSETQRNFFVYLLYLYMRCFKPLIFFSRITHHESRA